MSYTLANGKELTIGREGHTGLLQFLLPEDGGQLPSLLSGKFTAQRFVDEAWRQYLSKTPDLRTANSLAETRIDERPLREEKERPKLKYKKPKEVKSKDA